MSFEMVLEFHLCSHYLKAAMQLNAMVLIGSAMQWPAGRVQGNFPTDPQLIKTHAEG